MPVSAEVAELLREAEVDDENSGIARVVGDEEVVGFDVAVDKGFGVDVLDAGDLMSVSNWVGRGGGEGDRRGGVRVGLRGGGLF